MKLHKSFKRFTFIAIICVFCLTMCSAFTTASSVVKQEASDNTFTLYNAAKIQNDIVAYEKDGKASADLKAILKETSFDIAIPNIDMSKIASPTKISDLANKQAFYEELDKHNVNYDPDTITYSEYCTFEKTWTIDASTVKEIAELYPEFTKSNTGKVTYGTLLEYQIKKDKQDFGKKWFTDEQLAELKARKIQLDDAALLLKEYHNADVLLRQSDAVLKQIITNYYQINLKMIEKYAEIQDTASKSSSTKSNTPDLSIYTYVYFPQYNNGNGDYFHNDVVTNIKWQVRQANRARRMQSVIYNTLYSSTSLECTNMYGTYSCSQGGAHEGIDFAAAAGAVDIYSTTWGGRRYPTLSHQFAVHDPTHSDGAKTYSYLHMSSFTSELTWNDQVGVRDYIGTQGNVGNSSGYHVHFEVHSGNTGDLSRGNDDIVGSISPYRTTIYIGEGDPLPEEEQYW